MFKKFDEKESISGITQLKSSVQKGIRNKVREIFLAEFCLRSFNLGAMFKTICILDILVEA